MIALTVRQPFAWRIVHGSKRIENRSRSIATRGRVLIHAAAQPHDLFRGRPMDHLPFSAIVGSVQIVGSHNAETCGDRCRDIGGMYPGDRGAGDVVHHWELSDALAYADADIVPGVRGALGLWTPNPSDEYLAVLAEREARGATAHA